MSARLAGAFFLICAALLLGLGARRQMHSHVRALSQTLAIVAHARRRIDLFSTPYSELFADYPEKVDEEKIVHLENELCEDGALLRTFFDQLGSGYKEDTLRLCELTIARLEERLGTVRREYPARAKLFTAMPLLFAVSVIVLIL